MPVDGFCNRSDDWDQAHRGDRVTWLAERDDGMVRVAPDLGQRRD